MRGTGVIGRGGYRNEPGSWPAGQPAACLPSRYIRRAGMSAIPLSGLFCQAESWQCLSKWEWVLHKWRHCPSAKRRYTPGRLV